jgi:probable HAF family extracellular repeat protein
LVAGAAETVSADPLAENFCGFNAFFSIQVTGSICRGFLWRDGRMTALPPLGGNNSNANSVNNRGQAVGAAENRTRDPNCVSPQALGYEAVVWGPGTGEIQTLPPLAGDTVSAASMINERGQVIGLSGPCVSLGALIGGHAVIWDQGQTTRLGTLGGTFNVPAEINSRGQVAGTSTLQLDAVYHAYLWQKGVLTDLGVLPGDINNRRRDQ